MGLFSAQVSTKEMVPLCRQLATTYDGGIPIIKSLDLVAGMARGSKARQVIRGLSEEVQSGSTLGDAARKQARYLPQYFIELLSAGELSGQLSAMLRDLADYYEDRLAMRRSLIGMMVYPCLQLSAAWFLGSFALRLIRSLDFTGKTRFDLIEYCIGYLWFQLRALTVAVSVFAVIVVLARMGVFKWIWGWVTNYLWPIKTVTRKFALARFFRSMSLLVGSGMNIIRCIENSAAIIVNPYIQRDLLLAVPRIDDGATLYEAFSVTRSLTPVAREMLFVGEQSGNLEDSLRKVAEYHLEEANHAVKVATRILGVVILLTMAGLIGYLYITFFVTYYGGMMEGIG